MRKAASEATLAALQGRELTLKNIRGALKAVTEAASAGVAKNLGPASTPKPCSTRPLPAWTTRC